MQHNNNTNKASGLLRMRIVSEMLDSETRYLKSLQVLQKVFVQPIRAALDASICQKLFSNIDDIVRVSVFLQQELSSRLTQSEVLYRESEVENEGEVGLSLVVGDVLLQLVPFLKLYTTYCTNFSLALETVSELLSKSASSSSFSKIMKHAALNPECGQNRFDAFLILPIQRIPRYTMLLDKLLENTFIGHPDYENLLKSRNMTAQIASVVNNRIHEHEMFQEMLIIQRSLVGFDEVLIVPGRRLIYSGKITKVCRRSDQIRHLFLFSDILVYTMPVQQLYVFHRKIHLEHCLVKLMNDSCTIKHTFQIISTEKSFAAYTESAIETRGWVDRLSLAIQDLNLARNSLRIDTTEVHFKAPVWLPNKFSNECMICKAVFTLLSRKHHCRMCGSIVCGTCSQHTFTIPGIKSKPNTIARACDSCFSNCSNETTTEATMTTTATPFMSLSCQESQLNQGLLPMDIDDDSSSSSSIVQSFWGPTTTTTTTTTTYSTVNGSAMSRGPVLGKRASSTSQSDMSRRSSSQLSIMSFSGQSMAKRNSMAGISGVNMNRGISLSSLFSVASGGGGSIIGSEYGVLVSEERCSLCSEPFGFVNWKRICKSCCKAVCSSCYKVVVESGDGSGDGSGGDCCDACFHGVPPTSVIVNENGGWSYVEDHVLQDDD
ncbi:Dbl homology domain-containing protein [Obelidium mucronatum]|nr:Dbl homology domain-containing protein [Obelidium mucronatum]